MSKIPDLTFTGVSIATTYKFRVMEPLGGWALCTVNDETGELNVQSDWGDWSYRWSPNPKHLGAPTLTHFLGDRSEANYIACKLTSGKYDYGREFDAEATVRAMQKRLAERRLEEGRHQADHHESRWHGKRYYPGLRDEPLTAGIAREIWEALESLTDCSNENVFNERMWHVRGLDWVSEEPWNLFEHTEAWPFTVLEKAIIPKLIEECAKRISAMPAASEAPAP